MTDQPSRPAQPAPQLDRAVVALRSIGHPNSIARMYDFGDDRYEWRRLFAEVLGTFFLVLVAVGGGMVNARFGGHAVPYTARVVSPALMVMAVILFMGVRGRRVHRPGRAVGRPGQRGLDEPGPLSRAGPGPG
jgi:aquaporin Z